MAISLAEQAMPVRVAVLFFILLSTAVASAADWQHYINARFGTSADVPGNFTIEPPPENGDGQVFVAPDGSGAITVYGSYNALAETFEGYRQALIGFQEAEGWHLTYLPQGENWFVLSGDKDGEIVYLRAEAARGCAPELIHHIEFRYRASMKELWGPIVARGAKSLDGPCAD